MVLSQAAQAQISRKSQRLIHERSRVVWLGVKLREERVENLNTNEEPNTVNLQQ